MEFNVTLRGYDRPAVDAYVQRAQAALASNDPGLRATVRAEGSNLRVALRGYDRAQVEAFVAKVQRDLGGSGSVSTAPPPLWPSVGPPQFSVVLRGYDPAAVDDFLRRHADPSARAAALREVSFPVRLRGYDRGQVDAYVSGLAG